MQLRAHIAAIVFAASYLPLSFILLIQDLDQGALSRPVCGDWLRFSERCDVPLQHPVIAFTALVICAACFIAALGTLHVVRPQQRVELLEVRHVPADLMNYVLPYIVSFMSLDYRDASKFLGFFVFFSWIFLITYRSGQIMMNPVLTVFGWRLYEIRFRYVGERRVEHAGVALSNTALAPSETHRQVPIQDILIIKAGKNG